MSWYAKAYCTHKQDYPIFKLTHITDLEVLADGFAKCSFPELDKELGQAYPAIVLCCQQNMAYRLYDEFDKTQINQYVRRKKMHFVTAKGILSSKNGMNLYRGCSHGCIYCDSRSKCYHLEHVFEDIEVKENAIDLLEYALKHKRKKCMIGTGSMTDPYIPLEMEIRNVRKALHLIYEYGFGFTVITKSDRILRDLDLLQKINEKTKCVVQMTLTTYDEDLCKIIEPNVSTTKERFVTLKKLHDAGIPTVVWLTPILPFINDTEDNISGILDMCMEAKVYGIICFGMGLTLREGNREYFYGQLDRLFPRLKEKYIRTYGNQYIIESPNNNRLMELFYRKCSDAGIVHNNEQIFQYLHTFEEKESARQLSLWNLEV